MASSSIFMYRISSHYTVASDIYKAIEEAPEDANNYFNLQLLSPNELSGEYILVQNIEETFYNAENRSFEKRTAPRASVVQFYIEDTQLEIWGNKTNAGRLIFIFSNLLRGISIHMIEVSIQDIINKLKMHKVKISKVSFEDFLFTEDIVGNFIVDLSSYGDAFSVLQKYQDKIARMTIIIPCSNDSLKISITSKGSVIVYKQRSVFENDALDILHNLLLR